VPCCLIRSASLSAWARSCSPMRSASACASSVRRRASALASSFAFSCARLASASRSAAAAESASCWRTAFCWFAIIVRTGGTTKRTTSHTMTANPMSCPMNVDIWCLPSRDRGGDLDAEDAARQRGGEALHPRAKVRSHGVTLSLELLGCVLQSRGNLLLGLSTLFVDDLSALCPSLVASSRRRNPSRGQCVLVVLLGGGELLGRFLVVGSRFGDHVFALFEHPRDRRNHEGADHAEHDQENGQLDEEGAVRDEEVAPPSLGNDQSAHVTHLDCYLTGVAKTNSAMKARLMK